jgi:predicted short-subunit dehydrogenase-like oxidoreductase (DUF2520 family)
MQLKRTLNIIGCGKVGKVLGRLWNDCGSFQVQDVLNRSAASATAATVFIGAGRALAHHGELQTADAWLIGVPDDEIAACCRALADSGVLRAGDLVFHCSGALTSAALAPAAECGALVASAHPVRSFAAPEQLIHLFAGSFCGIEGDPAAVALLEQAFAAIGARAITIDASAKAIYHAASVFASNYLVTLLDVALDAYQKAGVPRATALQLMEPLVRGTIDNVFELGTAQALTGPIARRDGGTVIRQYRALREWDGRKGKLYRQLAAQTLRLARRKRRPPGSE